MQSKQLSANEYLLVFTEPDVELIAGLTDFAQSMNIQSGRFQAIGSISSATLAWWSADSRHVEKQTFTGQFEVVSLMGNLTTSDGTAPRVHAHAAIVGPNGVIAGHAVSLTVRASIEMSVTVFETPVSRVFSDDFQLWIIDLESSQRPTDTSK